MKPVPKSLGTPWQSQTQLVSKLTFWAAIVAGIVALALPGGYFGLAYRAEAREARIEARLHAAFIGQIASSRQDWHADVVSLIDSDLTPSLLPEARTIRNLVGQEIARRGPPIPGLSVTGTALFQGQTGPAGSVSVTRAMRPVLDKTLLVGLIGLALGFAIFYILRVLPLRALRRLIYTLKRNEVNARREVEARLRAVFDHSAEGIMTFDKRGVILSCNPAAGQIFREQPKRLVSRQLTDLLAGGEKGKSTGPLAAGLNQIQAKRSDGQQFPLEITLSATRLTGEAQKIGILRDISERVQVQQRLTYLANYDDLTGLPNRILFRDRLSQAMGRAKRLTQPMALMFMDLDNFKVVNDSLGHEVGDLLLRHVADVLRACLRAGDTVAHSSDDSHLNLSRLGGDEFTLILENAGSADYAATVADRILHALAAPFLHRDQEVYISASIGITIYPDDEVDLDSLIRHADLAMYRSKESGRNAYHFYSEDMHTTVTERVALEADLRQAVVRNEFVLYYQPKADLHTGAVTGVEALLRWNRPGHGVVGPDKFIGVLEDTGLIVPVGKWVIETACAEIASWDRLGITPMVLAINVSVRQFTQKDLPAVIGAALDKTGLRPERIEIELTESLLMADSEASTKVLAGFAQLGLRVGIDDFGTGYSSLSYLKRFNVDVLKIDRSFVQDTPGDAESCAIVAAIIAVARSLGLKTVAEGVESTAQMEFLRDAGCDEIQGYRLSRPQPPHQVLEWLHRMTGNTEDSMMVSLESYTSRGQPNAKVTAW